MGYTKLIRKSRRNKTIALKRVNTIQRMNAKPVIKKVDVEAVKAEWAAK
ncbi:MULTISPECIES: hypothetical protein [Flammeovirga]|uniref:Uncharacterized protein n=1 Tax=Flammeovirga agarivorans TaxID=2726742 RepID=A0A7X8SJA3_9BACT|nr:MULTISPECIES: hypothetical protein [Flammeovirga]NLR91251.1 hypothetical protein [Flammeovirga agarivorans]